MTNQISDKAFVKHIETALAHELDRDLIRLAIDIFKKHHQVSHRRDSCATDFTWEIEPIKPKRRGFAPFYRQCYKT